MLEKLREADPTHFNGRHKYGVRIVSDDGGEGKRDLDRFTTPKEHYPVVVTTAVLLTTGVDAPTCKNIVLARPVSNIVEFKQILGRGTRVYLVIIKIML